MDAVVVAPVVTELNAGSGTGEAVAGAGCGVPGVIGMVTVPGIMVPTSPFMMIWPFCGSMADALVGAGPEVTTHGVGDGCQPDPAPCGNGSMALRGPG